MQHLTNYEHTHIKHRCQRKEGMDRERERERESSQLTTHLHVL